MATRDVARRQMAAVGADGAGAAAAPGSPGARTAQAPWHRHRGESCRGPRRRAAWRVCGRCLVLAGASVWLAAGPAAADPRAPATRDSPSAGAGSSPAPGVLAAHQPAPTPAAGSSAYDFAYRLSGDRRVAPIQVFDDGHVTWLQFAPGQAAPAIFDDGEAAPRLLPAMPARDGFVRLEHLARRLSLRIGDIVAQVDYLGVRPAPQAPHLGVDAGSSAGRLPMPGQRASASGRARDASAASASVASGDVGPLAAPAPATRASTAVSDARALAPDGVGRRPEPVAGTGPAVGLPSPAGPVAVALPVTDAPLPASASPGTAAAGFHAAPADQNMRRVLERWARDAGWQFAAEHWTVDVDIPLVASATFPADFRQAVRGLLGATELGERPLQPCFYSNRVLRVVPLAQACDRTQAPGEPVAVRS